jgi:excisionase family DNA binding protein
VGVSLRSIRKYIDSGDLPSYRIGGLRRVARAALDAWLERKRREFDVEARRELNSECDSAQSWPDSSGRASYTLSECQQKQVWEHKKGQKLAKRDNDVPRCWGA